MSQPDLTPLQLYMRNCAALTDVKPALLGDENFQISTLEKMSSTELNVFIAFLDSRLSTGDEASNRRLFLDGHHYFVWKPSNAATEILKFLLKAARRVREDTTKSQLGR